MYPATCQFSDNDVNLPFCGIITGANNLYFSLTFYGFNLCFSLPFNGNITEPNNLYFSLAFYGNITGPNNLCFSLAVYGNITGPNNLYFSLPLCGNNILIKDDRLHTQALLLCPTNAVLSHVLGHVSISRVLLTFGF